MKTDLAKNVDTLPKEYSSGRLLFRENETLDSAADIRSVLGLYAQWLEHRSCVLKTDRDATTIECDIGWDRELREPEELWIRRIGPDSSRISIHSSQVTITIEIFGTAYEFDARLLPDESFDQEFGWDAIVAFPIAMRVFRRRAFKRIKISPGDRPVYGLIDSKSGDQVSVEVEEIGPTSLRVRPCSPLPFVAGKLKIGHDLFDAQIARCDAESVILQLQFPNGQEAGDYFEHYRSFAYPSLRQRHTQPPDAVASLYLDTGYVDKFPTANETDAVIAKLKSVWSTVGNGSSASADYLALDANGIPCGASSSTLAFLQGDRQLWAFHQLCARTIPELLDLSGQLYTWRAEYLAAKPELLDAIVWFDSSSRWIERIYVKFAQHTNNPKTITPVDVFVREFNGNGEIETRKYAIGNNSRYSAVHASMIAAGSPLFLNACGALDAIVDLRSPPNWQEIQKVGEGLAELCRSQIFEITVRKSPDSNPPGDSTVVPGCDRFIRFPKEFLSHFLSSVEHSIAVTKSKRVRNAASHPTSQGITG